MHLDMANLLLFILLVDICVKIHADIYAATAELEYLVRTRQKVIKDLHAHLIEEEKKISTLKRYYNLYKRENEKALKNITKYINNPVNAFITIKSLTTDLNNVEYLITAEREQKVTLRHEGYVYPTLVDLKGAAQGLNRLIKIYQLNLRDIADGKFESEESSSPMSAGDCYTLGRSLFKDKDFEMAILWMKEAYRKYNEDDFPYRFTDINILEYISYGYYKMGDIQSGLQWTESILNVQPNHEKAKQSMAGYLKRITSEIVNPKLEKQVEKKEIYDKMLLENYEELCRGELDLSIQIISRLTCRYLTESHPFLKIAPIKMEMKYLDPDVVLFHEFLNDREIDLVKNLALPGLNRAKVNIADKAVVAESRISKTTWFYDSQFDDLQRISDRVSRVTGLSMKTKYNQHMQICNYGIGGHYLPHFDPHHVNNNTYTLGGGIRLATVMLYMSDVPQGGATVFPKLGLRVAPVKGTALFWLNLHSSGEVNQATLHGSCPVLLGSKWVCNKWIYQAGQEFHKPCDLQFQPKGRDTTALPPPVLTISRDRRLIEEYKTTNTRPQKKRKMQHKEFQAKNANI